MALPLIAAGVAARIAAKKVATKAAKKAATNVTKKASSKVTKSSKATAQKSKTNQISKNSVKVTPANKSNPTNEVQNMFTNNQLKRIKSGDSAKAQMRLEEKRNQLSNQFFGKSPTVRVKSSEVKPYKVTGGVGSIARRAGEKAKKRGK
jgi:hypothetical protein